MDYHVPPRLAAYSNSDHSDRVAYRQTLQHSKHILTFRYRPCQRRDCPVVLIRIRSARDKTAWRASGIGSFAEDSGVSECSQAHKMCCEQATRSSSLPSSSMHTVKKEPGMRGDLS